MEPLEIKHKNEKNGVKKIIVEIFELIKLH